MVKRPSKKVRRLPRFDPDKYLTELENFVFGFLPEEAEEVDPALAKRIANLTGGLIQTTAVLIAMSIGGRDPIETTFLEQEMAESAREALLMHMWAARDPENEPEDVKRRLH